MHSTSFVLLAKPRGPHVSRHKMNRLNALCLVCTWLFIANVALPQARAQTSLSVPPKIERLLPSANNNRGQTPLTDASGNASNQPAARHLSQQEQASIILKSALLSAVWGPPARCMVSQEITLLDRTIRGSGEYARGASGVGEMKMILKVVAGDHLNSLKQVSDGRVLRIAQTIDGKEEDSHVDLGRVREYLGTFSDEDRQDPLVALHLAIGGQNEKIRGLCQQYNWTSVRPGKFTQPGRVEEVDVWWLRGERTSTPTLIAGTAMIDKVIATPDDIGMRPSQALIAIGRGLPMQFWLYHVEESRPMSPDRPETSYAYLAKIDYYDPAYCEIPLGTFNADSFVSTAGTDIDETNRYQPPLRTPKVR